MILESLTSTEEINRCIVNNSNNLLVLRFGDSMDPICSYYDDILSKIKNKVRKFVKIYVCEKSDVVELIEVLNLFYPVNIMLFYNRRHIRINLGHGNIEHISFMVNEDDLINILTEAYKVGIHNKDILFYKYKLKKL